MGLAVVGRRFVVLFWLDAFSVFVELLETRFGFGLREARTGELKT